MRSYLKGLVFVLEAEREKRAIVAVLQEFAAFSG
jgi:hypothetical protein